MTLKEKRERAELNFLSKPGQAEIVCPDTGGAQVTVISAWRLNPGSRGRRQRARKCVPTTSVFFLTGLNSLGR